MPTTPRPRRRSGPSGPTIPHDERERRGYRTVTVSLPLLSLAVLDEVAATHGLTRSRAVALAIAQLRLASGAGWVPPPER